MFSRSALAGGALSALLLTNCSGSGDLPETGATPDASSTVSAQDLVTTNRIGRPDAPNVFKFQMTQGHSAQSPTPKWASGFKQIFTKWAQDNPDWRIEITVTPSATTTQDQAKLLEAVRAGRGPDCAEIDSFMLPQFRQQAGLQPVTDLYGDDGLDGVFPFVRDGVKGDDGEAYAYWWNTDLRVLYRRTDLVPKAPKTWSDVQTGALAAKKVDPKVDGVLFNGGRWEGTALDWYATLWSQGGELTDDSGKPAFGTGQNRAATVAGLQYYEGLITSGAAPKRVATIMTYDDFLTAAKSQSVAMFIGGHWQLAQLKDVLGAEKAKAWEVSELPGQTQGATATGTGGWTVGVFSKDSKIVDACKAFIKAVYAGPANVATGQIPTNTALFDKLEEFSGPEFQEFRKYLQNGRARPGTPAYDAISAALQVAIGKVLTGSATPEQATDQAFDTAIRESK